MKTSAGLRPLARRQHETSYLHLNWSGRPCHVAIATAAILLGSLSRALKLDRLNPDTTCAMCGRTRCTLAPDRVVRAAGTSRWVNPDDYRPSYNATPGFSTPVVRLASQGPQIETMRCAGDHKGRSMPAKVHRPPGRFLQYPPECARRRHRSHRSHHLRLPRTTAAAGGVWCLPSPKQKTGLTSSGW